MTHPDNPPVTTTFDDSDKYPPGAYIVGAPKCGTTALAEYLADHPAIAFSDPKEPHYYADDLDGLQVCSDDAGYRACFSPTSQTEL